MNKFNNIKPNQNYERTDNGDVFTGKQIINLLEIATPVLQAVLLLGIQETDKPATEPHSRYGVAQMKTKGQK